MGGGAWFVRHPYNRPRSQALATAGTSDSRSYEQLTIKQNREVRSTVTFIRPVEAALIPKGDGVTELTPIQEKMIHARNDIIREMGKIPRRVLGRELKARTGVRSQKLALAILEEADQVLERKNCY